MNKSDVFSFGYYTQKTKTNGEIENSVIESKNIKDFPKIITNFYELLEKNSGEDVDDNIVVVEHTFFMKNNKQTKTVMQILQNNKNFEELFVMLKKELEIN